MLVALIRRMARGDQAALTALYDETCSMVHGLAVKILRDESVAEDVTGDVYMQAFREASRYDAGRGGPLTWLLGLARRRSIEHLRADVERRPGPAWPATIDAADLVTSTLTGESQRVVHAALAALTTEQRRAIELAYYAGMSQSEIAAALDQPLATIKTRIRSGMLALRDALAPFHAETNA